VYPFLLLLVSSAAGHCAEGAAELLRKLDLASYHAEIAGQRAYLAHRFGMEWGTLAISAQRDEQAAKLVVGANGNLEQARELFAAIARQSDLLLSESAAPGADSARDVSDLLERALNLEVAALANSVDVLDLSFFRAELNVLNQFGDATADSGDAGAFSPSSFSEAAAILPGFAVPRLGVDGVQVQSEPNCIDEGSCTPVIVFFGTDRGQRQGANHLSFTAERSNHLTLGKAIVTVPRAHRQVGQIPSDSWWWRTIKPQIPWFEDNPGQQLGIANHGVQTFATAAEFAEAMRAQVVRAGDFKDHAFIYVHGYWTTFEAAVYRAAQITYDLGDGDRPFGTAFVYTWPSLGAMDGYVYDSDSARMSEQHLTSFIELVAKKSGAKHIHLIAHSMGTHPLMNVLGGLSNKRGAHAFSEVVLAAPDIDAGEFPVMVDKMSRICRGITLYASSNDWAMALSRRLHGRAPRAGDIMAQGPVIASPAQTIDVSAINTDLLSFHHSTYAESKELLQDLWRLMRLSERPPNKRTLGMRPKQNERGRYWRYEY
jgi:esterase/lipase superfamily enzyme